MIKKIQIEHDGKTLFKGNVMNMPVKKQAVVDKSIELFDDDDPCIIHTSYVVKHFAEELGNVLHENNGTVELSNHPDLQAFMDVDGQARITKLK